MGVGSLHWSPGDVQAMQVALAAAASAAKSGEVPVGAAIVVADKVVAVGHNTTRKDIDPCGHAEIVAIREAANVCSNHRLIAATLYVTLEPCVMCVGAIAAARIKRVVFGAYDRKAGALGSQLDLADSPALNHRFEVNGGLLADESSALLQDFFRARR